MYKIYKIQDTIKIQDLHSTEQGRTQGEGGIYSTLDFQGSFR